jgi:hypothetical protein
VHSLQASHKKGSWSSLMVSPGRPSFVAIPKCHVIFNGTNWGDFVFHMEVHMDEQLL